MTNPHLEAAAKAIAGGPDAWSQINDKARTIFMGSAIDAIQAHTDSVLRGTEAAEVVDALRDTSDDWKGDAVCESAAHLITAQAVALAEERGKVAEWRQAEHDLSDAYLHLRALIPGAYDTPFAPTAEQVWATTEKSLRAALPQTDGADDGWIEWKGGENPVHPLKKVLIKMRDYGESIGRAGKLDWSHDMDDKGCEIVAYRVAEEGK